VVFVSSLSW